MQSTIRFALLLGLLAAGFVIAWTLMPQGTEPEAGSESAATARPAATTARTVPPAGGTAPVAAGTAAPAADSARPQATAAVKPSASTPPGTTPGASSEPAGTGKITVRVTSSEAESGLSGVKVKLTCWLPARAGGKTLDGVTGNSDKAAPAEGEAGEDKKPFDAEARKKKLDELDEKIAEKKKELAELETGSDEYATVKSALTALENERTEAAGGAARSRTFRVVSDGDAVISDDMLSSLEDVAAGQMVAAPAREWTAITDGTGRAVFTGLPDAAYSVSLDDTGWASAANGGAALSANQRESEVALRAYPAAVITGTVSDYDGLPMAGQPVGINQDWDGDWGGNRDWVSQSTTTNEKGVYRLTIPAGRSYIVSADRAERVRAKTDRLKPARGEVVTADLRFKAGSVLIVKVTGPDGPVAGAQVWLQPRQEAGEAAGGWMRGGWDGSSSRSAVTGADGMARMTGIAQGSYTLAVNHSELMNITTEPFAMPESGDVTRDIALTTGATLEVMVLGSDGRPVAGAHANANAANGHNSQGGPADADGLITIKGLEAQTPYTVMVYAEGYAQGTLTRVTAGDAAVIELRKLGSISGIVVDGATGQPVEDFTVSVTGDDSGGWGGMRSISMSSDGRNADHHEKGEFTQTNVDAGTWRVKVTSPKYATSYSAEIKLAAGDAVTGVRIEMLAGGTISGVVTENGSPVVGARVQLHDAQTGWWGGQNGQIVTDETGRYTLEHVEPGTRRVSVSHDALAPQVSQPIEVGNGKQHTVDFRLDAGATLTGFIYDAEGRPVEGASVNVWGQLGGRSGKTDATGRYTVTGLSPGDYWVGYALPGNENSPNGRGLQIRAGVNNRDFRPEAKGNQKLVGNVTRGGQPVAQGWMSLMRIDGNGDFAQKQAQTNANGEYSFDGVVPGKYRVQVWTDNVQKAETITIAEGVAETRVNLDIPEGVISGTVTGPDGKPIANASIRVRSMKSYLANPQASTAEELTEAWDMQWGQTSGDGKYEIKGIGAGEFAVTVIANGFAVSTKTNITVSGGAAAANFTLTAAGTLRVTVRDTSGQAVPDCAVTVQRPDGSTVEINGAGWMGMGQTDAGGKFETNSLDGTFTIVVTHADHPRKTAGPVTVSPGQVSEVAVTLEIGYTVTVTVKDANGALVQDAKVELLDAAGQPLAASGWATMFSGLKTDAAGTAAARGVGPGTYTIRITRTIAGQQPLVETPGTVTVTAHDESVTVNVAPAAAEPGDGDF